MKFTIEGSITIRVNIFDSVVKLFVQDTGIGIKVDDQYKILTAFGKVNSEENKKLNATGVGLGLLISNMIVKNLNKTD